MRSNSKTNDRGFSAPIGLTQTQTNRYSQLTHNANIGNPFAEDDDEQIDIDFRSAPIVSPIQSSSFSRIDESNNSRPMRQQRSSRPLRPPRPPPPPKPARLVHEKSVEMTRVGTSTNPFELEEGKIAESDRQVSEEIDEDEKPLPDSDGKPIIRTKEENKIIRFLVSKRVYKYPGCSDSWCSNYCSYVSNNHPFVSMVFVHYLHPFGRRQRLMVFLNGLFFAIFISFVIFETTLVPRVSISSAITI